MMHVIASFTIVPVDAGVSLSPYIAACREILQDSGLNCEYHANGTNIEGSWDDVMEQIKQCQYKVHAMGASRVFTTIQLGTRTDKTQSMSDKLASVESKLK